MFSKKILIKKITNIAKINKLILFNFFLVVKKIYKHIKKNKNLKIIKGLTIIDISNAFKIDLMMFATGK